MPKFFMIQNLLIIVPAILVSCSEGKKEVSIESLLNAMADRDAVAKYSVNNFRLKQQSSYNRASTSPEDSVGWFSNHDYNSKEKDHNFIRIGENNV